MTQLDFLEPYEVSRSRMESRFLKGEAQERALIDSVANTVIIDRLVPPKTALFNVIDGAMGVTYDGDCSVVYSVHRHALNQVCAKVHLPMAYANFLLPGGKVKSSLLGFNLNMLFTEPEFEEKAGQPVRFLHRIVGHELRGFLSRRFNRHLASGPLLRAFVEQCRAEGARPIEASTSAVRNSLKCLLPMVFEVVPGEHICLGAEWGNSDFGAGKMSVSQTVWRVSSGTAAVLDDGLSKAHIGSIIEDSDVEMSDDTAKKEVLAQQGAIRDHVRQYFSKTTVERMLIALRAAHDEQIPWSKLRVRLRGILSENNLEWLKSALDTGDSIIDLPPVSHTSGGERVPNFYWAASAVSALAAKTEDPDKKIELQKEAGKLLTLGMPELKAS